MESNTTLSKVTILIKLPDADHGFFKTFPCELKGQIYDLLFQEKQETAVVGISRSEQHFPRPDYSPVNSSQSTTNDLPPTI